MTDCFLVVALMEQDGQTADSSSTGRVVPGWQGGHPGRGNEQAEPGSPTPWEPEEQRSAQSSSGGRAWLLKGFWGIFTQRWHLPGAV